MMITMNQNALFQTTVRCKISEAQIKKYSRDSQVRQLKDERYSLYLRFKQNREQGSWIYYEYKDGKQKSYRIGKYPDLNAKGAFEVLNAFIVELTTGKPVSGNLFSTVDEVVCWYVEREYQTRNVSKNRITGIKSMADNHLMSNLHCLPIRELTHKSVDELLIKPLLKSCFANSYIRTIFQLLKVCFTRAKKLNYLTFNPMDEMKFTDFVTKRIDVKGSRLKPDDMPELLSKITRANPIERVLCSMMLCHGTRLGETRLAKWRHINLKQKRWVIPKENTKSKKEIVYPLSNDMVALLSEFKQWQTKHNYAINNVFPLNKRDLHPIHSVRASELVRAVSNKEWSAHDLRKVARTVWADLGVDYMVAETLLNHAKDKLDQAYIHTHLEMKKKEALNTYHQWLNNCCHHCLSADLVA